MNIVLFQRLLISACLAHVMTACQSSSVHINANNFHIINAELTNCISIADEFRQLVDSERVGNASAPAIKTLPMFHSNRFLDFLAQESVTPLQTSEWFSQSATLGAAVRGSENQNLKRPWSDSRIALIDECAMGFATAAKYSDSRQQALKLLPSISDHYDSLPQLLGFNWLLRPIFKSRIEKLHEEERRWFEQANSFKESTSYVAKVKKTPKQQDDPTHSDLEAWFSKAFAASPLKIPTLNDAQLRSLFALHSPRFTIEFEADNDRIGEPVWRDNEIAINLTTPTVYTLPSFTRFGTSNLLQLNYVVWFSQRKPTTWPDLFAGKIDGLIWRVTLDEKGKVLLYDSIHSCGCYHKYFIASDEVETRTPALSKEPAIIFKLADIDSDAGVHIRITANEHYVVGVNDDELTIASPYLLADYGKLSNLSDNDRSKSMFSASGIITDSRRLERYTLWPTGIRSVGAMRQWGSHATGFVEQQQFDDANLLDHYFFRLSAP